MACSPTQFRIGTSGWSYPHWKNIFYPPEVRSPRWLDHYQQTFDTVELNASFYRLPKFETFANWRAASPQGFLWTAKAHRGITHFTRLQKQQNLTTYLRAIEGLGDSLAAILFQLPTTLAFDRGSVGRFLSWLPDQPRFVIEPRHASWFEPNAIGLLQQHQVALAITDSGGRYCSAELFTTNFTYLRFHGPGQPYRSCYTKEQLRDWAQKLINWNLPAFIYFNNDSEGHAVRNAIQLRTKLESLAASSEPLVGSELHG
jgi:uncharacterized protein YecE (DUF72 family)